MVRRAPQPFNDGQMDLVVAALEGVFLVLNDSQHTFHTAKAVREMLGNKRSTRSGGTVYELPTLLLMQQIFATAKCRKVLTTQYGAQWQKCCLPGQSIPSGEEAASITCTPARLGI